MNCSFLCCLRFRKLNDPPFRERSPSGRGEKYDLMVVFCHSLLDLQKWAATFPASSDLFLQIANTQITTAQPVGKGWILIWISVVVQVYLAELELNIDIALVRAATRATFSARCYVEDGRGCLVAIQTGAMSIFVYSINQLDNNWNCSRNKLCKGILRLQ